MTKWLFLLLSGFITLIASTYVLGKPDGSAGWTMPIAIAAGVWLAVYFVATLRSYRTVYLLTTTFIVPLIAFHLSWIFIDASGLSDISEIVPRMEIASYARASWYTVLALSSMGIGISLMMIVRPARGLPTGAAGPEFRSNLSNIYWMGAGLLAASIAFFIMFVIVAGNPFAYSRSDFFETDAAGRGLGAFIMVFPGAAVTLVIAAQTLSQRTLAWGVAATGALLLLLSGYRSAILFPVLVAGALLAKTGRRIPVWIPILGTLAIIVSIPAITQLRQAEYGEIDTDLIGESFEQTRTVDGFVEVGGTIGVLAKTLDIVPDIAPYQYGKTYYIAIRDALPNIGLRIQDSPREDALRNRGFGNEALFNLSPADWITYYVNPYAFAKGHGTGVGFSAIAEPYVNFGYLGVVIYFLLLGAGLAYLDGLDLRYHPWILLLCSAAGWALLKTVRNSFGNFIKPLIFVLIVIAIWRLVSTMLPIYNRARQQRRALRTRQRARSITTRLR